MKTWTLSILGILGLVGLIACSVDLADGERAVATFREQFARGAYAEMYRSAAPEFRQMTSEPEFLRLMTTVNSKLGAFKSAVTAHTNTYAGIEGKKITIVYQSEFERGKATEKFAFVVKQKTAFLVGYHIQMPLGL